jgi:hypothetical protein
MRNVLSSVRAAALASVTCLCVLQPRAARAQGADAAKPVTPQLDFSGVFFGNFAYRYDDATKNANGGNATNKFDVGRVYLNFRMPAGDDGSIRVTPDIFQGDQSAASFYKGWAVRMKYAYFQYNYLHDIGGSKGFNATARLGMTQTALVEFQETFWPRSISQVATELNGYFASSDVGVSTLVTLPGKWGEVYATIMNGTNYSSGEADPYKDYAARLTLTPFGSQDNILKTFSVSPWISLGKSASKFLTTAGSAGTPAADGLTKNRAGVFVGLKDRRLTFGAEWAQRTETIETGATLATRGSYDNTQTLTSAFVIVRPVELFGDDPKVHSAFGLMARLDNNKPFSDQRSAGPTTGTQTTSSANQFLIAGVFWDLNARATFTFDIQNLSPQSGSTTAESKVFFAHWNISF